MRAPRQRVSFTVAIRQRNSHHIHHLPHLVEQGECPSISTEFPFNSPTELVTFQYFPAKCHYAQLLHEKLSHVPILRNRPDIVASFGVTRVRAAYEQHHRNKQ
jgi:hypothetical protein